MTALKSVLAASALTIIGLAAAAPAQADVGIGVFFAPKGFGGIGIGVGVGVPTGHYHAGYGHCSKPEALDRAASMGVKKRYVSGVSDSRITVKGMKQGQPVRVVMYRNTGNCAIRSVDYI